MKIYVGNLTFSITDEDLRKEFETFGRVSSADVVKDQQSQRSKGFGFVEMPEMSEARAAIDALHGQRLESRPLKVSEARSRGDGAREGGGWKY